MKSYDVKLLPSAYSDLDEITDYLLANNVEAAKVVTDNIFGSLSRLELFPLSGALVQDSSLTKYQFRMVVIDPYIAFYRFIDKKVLVYRVLHGSRDLRNLLHDTAK